MLIGREAECRQIERWLAAAAEGRGSGLVVRGEPGVGKTTLLEYAISAADGFRVLRVSGVESEAEIAFAALHELVHPVVGVLHALPPPQARALKAALALADAEAPDRFSVDAGTLGLLSAAAAEGPVLCAVDDAHWLDRASAEALVFAARRIEHDPVAMLIAARDTPSTFAARGVTELRLRGLTDAQAKDLLAARASWLLPAVAERLVRAADGNPLALLEFAPLAADCVEAGEPLPVGSSVEHAFLLRSSRLSRDAQRALLVVAASDPAEPEALWAALESEAIGSDPLTEAEEAGLLVRGSRLTFTHPLARSALYQAATPAERRAVHRTLATVTQAPDRRAWHVAAATADADEEVAAALEDAAAAAKRRAGVSAEAAALERAAQLTPSPEQRARRLVRAGVAANAAGLFERAAHLFESAAELTTDAELHSGAVARRAYVLYECGDFHAALELATAAAEQAPSATFARVLGEVHVHRLEIEPALAAAERAAERTGDPAASLDLCQMLAWTRELAGRVDEGRELTVVGTESVERGSLLAIDFATHFLYLEEYDRAREALEQIVAHEREAGALGNLVYALDQLSRLETRAGTLRAAYASSLESVQLTEPLGSEVGLAAALGWLALVEAMLGRTEARTHGLASLEIARKRGDRWNEVRARAGLGLEALARGDCAGAVEWLEPAAEMLARGGVRHVNVFRVDGDLIEAQVRAGKRSDARRQLARLLEDGELTNSGWAMAVGARCRGLLARGTDAIDAFEEALDLHEREQSEWERARTQLMYGERLRRLNRRRDAREQLYEALGTFDEVGSRPWSDRARAELRATGERLRRRGPALDDQLTPQELQVSLLTAEGLTNKEIAARLFLSPKTVEFHLSHAYRKLDVRGRGELIKLFAAQGVPAEPSLIPSSSPGAG